MAAVASAANVPDTRLFPKLPRLARVACITIAKLHADAGCDSRGRRPREGIRPLIRKGGGGHGSGPGVVRSVVERVIGRLLRYKRLDRRQDRSSAVVRSLPTAVRVFIAAERIFGY
jgi:hypothetical protein